MFSSTNNSPLPQLPSSSFQIPFTDAAGFFPFHSHIDPLLACNNYLAPNYTTNAPLLTSTKLKKAARKDRHSKISTSQGLRDRRVRLSIGISREFFDLQDKLGFETASKTIEWLLGKSKKDIQELKNKSSSPSYSSNDGDQEGVPKKVKMSQKDDSAREYRAKKRERARERTREKSCIVPRKCASDDHHYHHNQESNPNSGLTQLGPHYIHNNITTNNNMTSFLRVEEAIASQTKMMMVMSSPTGELKRV